MINLLVYTPLAFGPTVLLYCTKAHLFGNMAHEPPSLVGSMLCHQERVGSQFGIDPGYHVLVTIC
jgi:hypothetical protein